MEATPSSETSVLTNYTRRKVPEDGLLLRYEVFLTSALVGCECLASRLGSFTPRETAPNTSWIGGYVSPRADLEDVEKTKFLTLPGLENSPVASRYTHCAIPAPYDYHVKKVIICLVYS
jgi:hypothetical protein